MPISIYILIAVLLAIAFRKLVPVRLPIWVIMTVGALLSLATLQISPKVAWHAIDWNIIGYLFGVFVLGQALEESGYTAYLSYQIFKNSQNTYRLLFFIIFSMGLGSAILMNDTLAIIGTPVVLHIARKNKLPLKPLLFALVFAITIGSVSSPIGNPQNLLIAIKGKVPLPFMSFIKHLAVPTLINLLIAYLFILLRYAKQWPKLRVSMQPEVIHNKTLAKLSKIGLQLMLLLILIKIILAAAQSSTRISFSVVAMAACAPMLLISRERKTILKNMDWGTLLFFVSLFVLMQSVWDSGFFQAYLAKSQVVVTHTSVILLVSAVLSQFISNVPLVALYLPMLLHKGAGLTQLMALAAGSTIAGNFLIMGAASNVIVLQNAEKRGERGFGFFEFALLGVPLGIVNLLVYWWWLN